MEIREQKGPVQANRGRVPGTKDVLYPTKASDAEKVVPNPDFTGPHGPLRCFHQSIRVNTEVRASPGQVRAHAYRVVGPALVRVPASRGLAVRREANVRENGAVGIALNEVFRLAAKAYREFGCVGRLNDLFSRRTAHEPRGEQVTRKFGLRVPRGHVDDQAFQVSARHAFKLFGYDSVVTARDEVRPDRFHEIQEVLLRLLVLFDLRETELKLQKLLLGGG